MKYGQINLIVGALGIVLASFGGFALGATYDASFVNGIYAIDLARGLV